MSTPKITPKSLPPSEHALNTPLNRLPTFSVSSNSPSTSITTSASANHAQVAKPAIHSRQCVTSLPVELARPEAGRLCKATGLTLHGEKLNALAARVLPELLGLDQTGAGESSVLTRGVLERAIASPMRAADIRQPVSDSPADLINESMVTHWSSRLVAACDAIYETRGAQAYIEALTDLVFDEGEDTAGLPDPLRDFCAMLTKNALEIGLAQGLDRQALQGLRNTVVFRFLMGQVFVPHCRPTAMRESTDDKQLYNFDRQLFKRFCHKTTAIIDIDAEAMVLLAVSRQTPRVTESEAAATS
jgi:hypothetical protein